MSTLWWVDVIGLIDSFRGETLCRDLAALGLEPERTGGIRTTAADAEGEGLFDSRAASRVLRRTMLDGEVGCALAHREAYKKFIESDRPFGLFFEDDVSLLNALPIEDLGAALSSEDPVVVTLVQPPSYRSELSLLSQRSPSYGRNDLAVTPVLAAAYALNRSAAIVLLDAGVPVRFPADWPVRAGGVIRWMSYVPDVVTVRADVSSAISARAERHVANGLRSIARRLLAILHIPLILHPSDYGSYSSFLMHEFLRGPYFATVSAGKSGFVSRAVLRILLYALSMFRRRPTTDLHST